MLPFHVCCKDERYWMRYSRNIPNRWHLYYSGRICSNLSSSNMKHMSSCISWASPISPIPYQKLLFACLDSFGHHFCQCLPITRTGYCCFDLCLGFQFLALVLVPQGNSVIWTQFYKSNRKISSSEVIAIVSDRPISFLSHCFFTGKLSWEKRWAEKARAFIFTKVCKNGEDERQIGDK